ncbi:uncharacterized protein LOC126737080 isoform X2 [Anthonomus grandis grandis]|nr:uncharacterized protein LOC126737080 isoform X2 [Anthonomus grandis grandis]
MKISDQKQMLADVMPKMELKILPVSKPDFEEATWNTNTSINQPPSAPYEPPRPLVKSLPCSYTFSPIQETPPPTPQPPAVTFGWAQIDAINPAIPYINRGSLYLVAKQIYFPKIVEELKIYFTTKIYECLSYKTYAMTEEEALGFNDINRHHCDYQLVGNHVFMKDMPMIELDDLKQMVEFLKACFEAFFRKNYENNLFGFIRIGGESEVPFVWCKEKKMLPLFYFDGQMDYLDQQSIELTDKWQLDYLKFCCLIHSIRKEHYEKPSIKVVDLDVIKSLSEQGTNFEVAWPKISNPELLINLDLKRPQLYTTSKTSFLKLPFPTKCLKDMLNSPVLNADNLTCSKLFEILNRSQAPVGNKKVPSKPTIPKKTRIRNLNMVSSTINGKNNWPETTIQKSASQKSCPENTGPSAGQPSSVENHQPSKTFSQQKHVFAPYIRHHIRNGPQPSPQLASCPSVETSTYIRNESQTQPGTYPSIKSSTYIRHHIRNGPQTQPTSYPNVETSTNIRHHIRNGSQAQPASYPSVETSSYVNHRIGNGFQPQPASCPTFQTSTAGQPPNQQVTTLNQSLEQYPLANPYQPTHRQKLNMYEQQLVEQYFMSQKVLLNRSQAKTQAWEMATDFLQHSKLSSELVGAIYLKFYDLIRRFFKCNRGRFATVNIVQNINLPSVAPAAAQNVSHSANMLLNRQIEMNNSVMVPENLSVSRTVVNHNVNYQTPGFLAPNSY